ncbi:MAG: TlpA family protein disulfide reductase [Deltaproteobacteria bacterium]|nr:TlpA family protein disulfide reductase [Deltaproteobacteria bacterium]MBW2661310.1 TlpA family protein disulfide reductase [Deltaproteobacteria bacterium]
MVTTFFASTFEHYQKIMQKIVGQLIYALLIIGSTIALPGILSTGHSEPADRIIVESITSVAFDKIIADRENRYLIVFMTSWCGPCRKELPQLINLYNKYKNCGLKIIGISLDFDGPMAIQPIIDKSHVNFPVYWINEKAAKKYNVYAVPMLLLVKEGRIVKKFIGTQSEKFLDKKLADFLR